MWDTNLRLANQQRMEENAPKIRPCKLLLIMQMITGVDNSGGAVYKLISQSLLEQAIEQKMKFVSKVLSAL
jgi:hypothetical protein